MSLVRKISSPCKKEKKTCLEVPQYEIGFTITASIYERYGNKHQMKEHHLFILMG